MKFFKKNILLSVLFFLGSITCFGQGGFKKKYYLQNSFSSTNYDVIEAPNGNLIILGYTLDTLNSTSFNRLTIIGTDAQGNLLWRKNYGNMKFQYLGNSFASRGILKDNTGFYFTCPVLDSLNIRYNSALVKFDFAGDTLWQKVYKDTTYDLVAQSVAKSVDNGLILVGYLQKANVYNQPIILLKTDINGNELWRKQFISSNTTDPGWSAARAVQDSATKQIIIVGYQIIGVDVQSLIMATDSLGVKLWLTTFNNQGGGVSDLIQTKDKNFISSGSINSNNNLGGLTRYKSLVVKFGINANLIWSKTYDTLSPYTGLGNLNELASGDLVMAGNLDTMLNHNILEIVKLRVIKTDKDGNVKWKRYVGNNYDYASSEFARSMNPTQDGGFVIAAWPFNAANPQPYSIVKIDSTGCDTTEAYCKSVAAGIGNFTKLSGWEFTVFPNPAKDALHIKVDAPLDKNIGLKISDVTGREIVQMPLETNKEIVLNTTAYTGGVYLLSLLYEHKIFETKRLVIVR